MHETWEAFARDIQLFRPNSCVYAIFDASLFMIEGFERAIRSDVPPYRARTLDELAHLIDIPSDELKRTVALYNAAATGDVTRFDAGRRDGLATAGWLAPPKLNWHGQLANRHFLPFR